MGTGMGTGTGAGTETTAVVNGNGDEDGNEDGNEDRIGKGGREAKKRKKPQKCRRHVGSGGGFWVER